MDGAKCDHQQSVMVCGAQRVWAGKRAMVSRRDKHCISASGAEVAEPAQRATELARRRGFQRAIEADLHLGRKPWLGPSALPGRARGGEKVGNSGSG